MIRFITFLFMFVSCASVSNNYKTYFRGYTHDNLKVDVDLNQTPYTVFIFMSSRCPCSESHNHIIKNLSEDYTGVRFVGVHSNYNEKITHVKAYFEKLNFNFPVVYDSKSFWAKDLGAVKTPHVFILNSFGETVYSGNITNSSNGRTAKINHLKIALDDIKSGHDPIVKRRKSLGCYIPIKD